MLPVVTLHLHRAARTDVLADALARLLATPLADPFAEEVVVVPAKGVERWLSQRLSHHLGAGPRGGDGVCAGVGFRTPWSLFAEVAGTRDEDPWSPESLVWPLLAAVDDSLEESWALPLARHLGRGLEGEEADLRHGRRFAVARRLAHLFASYATQRPALVSDWAAGRDTDGRGHPLPADLTWQPELWRRVAARVGCPDPAGTAGRDRRPAARRARRLRPARPALAVRPHPAAGDRGHAARRARSRTARCTCGCRTPRAALWDALARAAAATGPVAAVPTTTTPPGRRATRCSSTLGRDVRELQRTLAGVATVDEHVGRRPAHARDPAGLAPARPARQRRRRRRRPARCGPTTARCRCTPATAPARQVDVLREVLLGLLADDPTLEPRDVLVMCPDIETFAPLISAGFGLGDVVGDARTPRPPAAGPPRRPRAHPAPTRCWRSPRGCSSSPAAAPAPATCSTWPTPSRYAAASASATTTSSSSPTGSARAGVRWAFDAEHRAEFGLSRPTSPTPGASASTGCSPASRCRTTPAPGWTAPCRSTTSAAARSTWPGDWREFVDRLRTVTDQLVGAHPLEHWLERRSPTASASLSAVPASDGLAARAGRSASSAGSARPPPGWRPPRCGCPTSGHCSPTGSAGRPTRANFRTGTLTVCTMVPMRSVPHRVVCLLGLDDGVFPRVGVGRRRRRAGPRPADRRARPAQRGPPADPRRDPRRHRAPRRHLHRRQRVLRPAAPARRTARRAARRPRPHRDRPGRQRRGRRDRAAPAAALRRPQPASRARWCPARPFTFDRAALAGARAAAGASGDPAAPFLSGPLPPAPTEDVSLDDLPRSSVAPARCGLPAASGSTSRCPARRSRSTTACRSRSTSSRSGRSATGCCATCCAGIDVEQARQQEWRRGRAAPGHARLADPRRPPDARRAARRRARARRRTRAAARRRRRRRPRRRPAAARHRRRRVRRPAGAGHLLPARRHPPAAVLDPAAGAGRRPTTTRAGPPTPSAGPPTAARARPSRSRCSGRSTTPRSAALRDLVGAARPRPAASRCRCRSRRRWPTPAHRRTRATHDEAVRQGRLGLATTAGSPASSPTAGAPHRVGARGDAAGARRRAARRRGVRGRDHPLRRARAAAVEPAAGGRAGELVMVHSVQSVRSTGEQPATAVASFEVTGDCRRRHDAARGQRRHRQDLHRRRAGHPLRRRGRRRRWTRCSSSPSAAPRARSCASGSATSSSRPSARSPTRRRADRRQRGGRPPARRREADAGRDAAAGCATRSPPSTPPPSPPPTSSARWCCARSASPVTPTPAPQLVETLDDLRRGGRRRPLPPRFGHLPRAPAVRPRAAR